MEKRIGSILVLIEDKSSISKVNSIISQHADIIIARQGLPVSNREISLISIVLEGDTDMIGSLSGQLGRINGIRVKSLVMKQ